MSAQDDELRYEKSNANDPFATFTREETKLYDPNLAAYRRAIRCVRKTSFERPFGNKIYQAPANQIEVVSFKRREIKYSKEKYGKRFALSFVADGQKFSAFKLRFPQKELSLTEQETDIVGAELESVFSYTHFRPYFLPPCLHFWLVRLAVRAFVPHRSARHWLGTPIVSLRVESQEEHLVVAGSADMIGVECGTRNKAHFEFKFAAIERPPIVPEWDNFFCVEPFQLRCETGKFTELDVESVYNAVAWIQSKLTGRIMHGDSIQQRADKLLDLYNSYAERPSPVVYGQLGRYDVVTIADADAHTFDRWRDPLEWQYRREWAEQRYKGVFDEFEALISSGKLELVVAYYNQRVQHDATEVKLPPVIDRFAKPGYLNRLKAALFDAIATKGRLEAGLEAVAHEADAHIVEHCSLDGFGESAARDIQDFFHKRMLWVVDTHRTYASHMRGPQPRS